MFFANTNLEIIFQTFTSEQSWIYIGSSLFYFFGVLSGIIGAVLKDKINNKNFLWIWITFGVLTTGLLLFFKGELFILIIGPLLGISLGLGFPYCLSLFAEFTTKENRGRVSGIILLETFFMASIAIIVNDIIKLGLVGTILLLIILRSTSFLALVIDECKTGQNFKDVKKRKSWTSILTYKGYVYYFVPWLMFIVAAVLTDHLLWPELPKNVDYDYVFEIGNPLHYLGTAIFAMVSGVMADRYGRKPSIIIGLAIFGFSYALIGSIVSPESVFIHLMTIGIAFGFVWVIYIAIPGDLAVGTFEFSREKFYALILVLPLAVYGGLGAVPRVFGITVQPNILSPILSLILFLSVITILYAPRILRKSIVARKMKEYAKKITELVNEEG